MTLQHFAREKLLNDVMKEVRCTEEGTSAANIVRALRRNSLRVGYRAKMSMPELIHCIDAQKVVIVYLDGDHYGVVHAYDDTRVFLADPAPARMDGDTLTYPEFMHRWTRWGLVVSP